MVTPAKMAMLARLHITAIEPERVLAQAASPARYPEREPTGEPSAVDVRPRGACRIVRYR